MGPKTCLLYEIDAFTNFMCENFDKMDNKKFPVVSLVGKKV